MNAPVVDSSTKTEQSRISWRLDELPEPKKDAPKVVSTFSCGGGSTMGYKRLGFDVIAANDIDPEMVAQYKLNFPDTDVIEAPIGDLAKDETLTKKWRDMDIDILDGSPPCTLFSTSNNNRQDHWGKERMFREGQAVQILDALFLDYLELVDQVRPKVFIAENVEGMVKGVAKGYAREVLRLGKELGYEVTLIRAYASWYGVPQLRPRVFFVGRRQDLRNAKKPMKNPPQVPAVTAGEAFRGLDQDESKLPRLKPGSVLAKHWDANPNGGRGWEVNGKMMHAGFQGRLTKDAIYGTVAAAGSVTHYDQKRRLTPAEFLRMATFADDYKLLKETSSFAQYLVGMSVPPFFMEAIAGQVQKFYLKD